MTDHLERKDITANRERAESSERTDPIEPIESSEPNEPTDPIDRAEPTDPMDSTEPFEATDSSEFSDQRDQREPCRGFVIGLSLTQGRRPALSAGQVASPRRCRHRIRVHDLRDLCGRLAWGEGVWADTGPGTAAGSDPESWVP